MKKILCVLISVLMLMPSAVAFAAINPEDDGHTIERYTENFSEYENPENMSSIVPEKWAKNGSAVTLPVDHNDGVHDVSLGMKIPSSTTGHAMWLAYDTLNADDKNFAKTKISFDYYTDRRVAFKVYTADGSNGFNFLEVSGDSAWHSAIIYFNCLSKELTVYIDGVLKNDAVSKPGLPSHIGTFRVETVQKATEDEQWFYIDNFSVYTAEPLGVTATSPESGCEDFPRKDGEVIFTFDRELREDENSVKVTDKDGNIFSGFSSAVEGDKIKVTFADALSDNMEYTVSANGESVKINTSADKLIVGKPVKGDDDTFSVYVNNQDAEKRWVTLVAAVYDADNKMKLPLEIQQKEFEIGEEDTLTSLPVVLGEGEVCRAFVIDNADNLNLLRSDFYGAEEVTYSGKGISNFTLGRVLAENDRFYINANHSDAGERCVLVTSKDADGNIDFISPVICNEKLEYSFAPNKEDTFTVYFSGRKSTEVLPVSVLFTSAFNQERIIGEINDAENAEELGELLVTYKAEADLCDEILEGNGYDIVFERLPVSLSEIKPLLESAKELLRAVNDASWSMLREIILENDDILLYGNEDFEYYKNQKEFKQNAINKKIVKYADFDSIKMFKSVFSQQVAASKKTPVSLGGGGGGGNTGGISGGTNVATPGSGALQVQPPQTSPEPEKSAFLDIAGAEWAEESINYLYSKNIISGDGNGNFRPSDNISREEFIKVVIEAFETGDKNAVTTFKDAESGAWYIPYLAAAQSLGIVKGDGEKFGVGEKITRQDMSVILYRVLKAAGKLPYAKENGVVFTDNDNISEYAKEAVITFKNANIISGMPDGSFAPFEKATRAQVCALIYNILKGENK